jgi:hypothetical protein
MEPTVITMTRDKECKHSVRFATPDEAAPVSTVYVSRELPGIDKAQSITVTVQVAG